MRLSPKWKALLAGPWAPIAQSVDGKPVFRERASGRLKGRPTTVTFFAAQDGEMWVVRDGREIARGFDTSTFPPGVQVAIEGLVLRLIWCAEHRGEAPRPVDLVSFNSVAHLEDAILAAARVAEETRLAEPRRAREVRRAEERARIRPQDALFRRTEFLRTEAWWGRRLNWEDDSVMEEIVAKTADDRVEQDGPSWSALPSCWR